jgi:hypothetical protein
MTLNYTNLKFFLTIASKWEVFSLGAANEYDPNKEIVGEGSENRERKKKT